MLIKKGKTLWKIIKNIQTCLPSASLSLLKELF